MGVMRNTECDCGRPRVRNDRRCRCATCIRLEGEAAKHVADDVWSVRPAIDREHTPAERFDPSVYGCRWVGAMEMENAP